MLRDRFILLCLAVTGCRNEPSPTTTRASAAQAAAPSNVAANASPAAAASAAPASKHETDTLSRASEAYDAGPPVMASGAVDGAELRKRHAARLKSERSQVTVLRGDGPLELGRRICEAVVPKRSPETP